MKLDPEDFVPGFVNFRWVLGIYATVAVAAIYLAGVFTAGWVYEDRAWIGNGYRHRPLATWVWSWATQPTTAHTISFALHVTVGILVGLVAYRVLRIGERGAWVAATLFLVSGIGPESAAYAAQRGELLAAVGVLSACLCAGEWTQLVWIFVGCLGKESAAVGAVLVPWVRGDDATTGYRLGALGIAAWFMPSLRHTGWDRPHMADAGWWLMIQCTAAVRTTFQTVVPWALTVDYDYDAVDPLLRVCAVYAWILGGLFVAFEVLCGKKRWARCVLWTWLAVLPRLVVQTPRSYLNLHQFYTPLVGLTWAAGDLYDRCRRYAVSSSTADRSR